MKNLAPYQIFFPLGLLNAILAIGIWFSKDLMWFQIPTLFIHSKLVVGGFLWSFILGFLMTAVPRMTGTAPANKLEYLLAFVLWCGQTLFSWDTDIRFFYINQILLVLFIIVYGGRRVLRTTKPIPVFFSHVTLAMLLALSGSYFHLKGQSLMGLHLYHLGAVLLLVLGIGTRFFSFLSGLPSEFEAGSQREPRLLFHTLGLLTAIFLFLAGTGRHFAYLVLASLSLVYLFSIWKAQRTSPHPSALKYGVRIAAVMIPLSFFLSWIYPHMFLTWFHLLFIGCFAIITLSVATRVTLAHGSYSLDIETKSRSLYAIVFFLSAALLFRILYGFVDGDLKVSSLHLAGIFWILAILSWCLVFLPKIFIPGPQAKPSC